MVRKKRCRICESTEDLIMIFTKENQEILRMLESIAAAPIMKNDYLPQHICPKCSNDLKATYSFKMLYAMTSTKMKDMLISPKRFEGEIPSNICDLKSEEATDGISTKTQSDQSESCFEVLIMRSDEKDDDNEPLGDIELTELDVCGYKICLEIETYSRDNQEDCLKEETSKKTQEDLTNATTASDTKDNTQYQCGEVYTTDQHISSEWERVRQECEIMFSKPAVLNIGGNNSVPKIYEYGNYDVSSLDRTASNLQFAAINSSLSEKQCNKFLPLSFNSNQYDEYDQSFITLQNLREQVHLDQSLNLYKCHECGKAFKRKRNLKEHIVSHSDLCKCRECGKSFGTLQGLKEHVALHVNPDLFKCDECGKSFTAAHNLKQHKASHSVLYKCNECDKSFGTLKSLSEHVAWHKNPDLYKCDECGKTFQRKESLKEHKVSHSNLNKCNECGKLFGTLRGLKFHEASHYYPEICKCDACGKPFRIATSLKDRKISGSNLNKCNECNKSLGGLQNLNVQAALLKNPGPYKCDECGKSFLKPQNLKQHKFTHSKLNKCNECGKSFGTIQNLKDHVALHKNPDLYKCDKCDKTFTKAHTLNQHIFSHSDLNKCDECDKSFGTLKSLEIHKALHKNPDLYKCDKCDRSFTKAHSLNQHKFSHSEFNKCNECGKSFGTLKSLKYHVALHKNPDLLRYDEREQVFSRTENVVPHTDLNGSLNAVNYSSHHEG